MKVEVIEGIKKLKEHIQTLEETFECVTGHIGEVASVIFNRCGVDHIEITPDELENLKKGLNLYIMKHMENGNIVVERYTKPETEEK